MTLKCRRRGRRMKTPVVAGSPQPWRSTAQGHLPGLGVPVVTALQVLGVGHGLPLWRSSAGRCWSRRHTPARCRTRRRRCSWRPCAPRGRGPAPPPRAPSSRPGRPRRWRFACACCPPRNQLWRRGPQCRGFPWRMLSGQAAGAGGARPPRPAARRMAGGTSRWGGGGGGSLGADGAAAAQGADGDLGDRPAPGQADGQPGRDQQLDADPTSSRRPSHRPQHGIPAGEPFDQLWTSRW